MEDKEMIERIRKEEQERIKRFKKYLEEQTNWIMSKKDVGLLLDVVEDFLEGEEKVEKLVWSAPCKLNGQPSEGVCLLREHYDACQVTSMLKNNWMCWRDGILKVE
uniref:Uncharacterized protein n=1 Tax=viral metagenome TaxID=1070528 RepID=A0A6M3XGH0_9ZZZZ